MAQTDNVKQLRTGAIKKLTVLEAIEFVRLRQDEFDHIFIIASPKNDEFTDSYIISAGHKRNETLWMLESAKQWLFED